MGHLGYLAAGAVVALMGWTLHTATVTNRESAQAVGHTLEVLRHLSGIDESLGRADAGQRGFLLRGEARYANERETALAKVAAEVAEVRRLTAKQPEQQTRLAALEQQFAERVAVMRRSAALRTDEGLAAFLAKSPVGVGQVASNRVYALGEELRQEEERLLAAQREIDGKGYEHALAILIVAVVISMTLMIPGYIAFNVEARARRRAEATLINMAESLPGAVYRFRTPVAGPRRFEFVSAGVEPLRGITVAAAMKDFDAMWDTMVEDDQALVAETMARAEKDLQPVQYDFRVKRPEGALRWLRASATLRKEPDGSILWNGYWTDVTREKVLQRELQEARDAADAASRAKGTFLATMSHEIRTPMNGVLGMLELLALTRLDGEQRTKLGIVQESGRSLLRIIDDILDFSKIDAGKLEVRPEAASVPNLIERVCNIYSGNASSKGLLLRRFVDKNISPAVIVDPLRLQQILNNFVSNAIKFTDRGHVEVRADLVERRELEELVRFSVVDTGVGVSAHDKAQLFTPFSQVADRTRGFGGTGLGLAICRRLAELMGGVVEMHSEPGAGTTMTLTLALGVAEPQALADMLSDAAQTSATAIVAQREPPTIEAARASGTLVLVVDDHPINRTVLQKQVNALGHAAEVAENGLQALEKLRLGGVAIVLTDCNMPEMSGYELARHIRAVEARDGRDRIPVIACTANALGGEAENCLAAGMDDYLAKPIPLNKLAQILEAWMPAGASTPRDCPSADPIDRCALAEFSGGDRAAELELLGHFRRYNAEDGRVLANAVDKREMDELAQAAHRISGASRTIGALGLAAASEEVERASRANDWVGVHSHMVSFWREFHLLDAYIAAFVASPRSEACAA